MGRTRSRLFAALPLFLCLAATTAGAQQQQLFQNSWFWGLHAGGTVIGTPNTGSGAVGTVGADWMITRTDGGLYVSYDQASFGRMSAIADSSEPNGSRQVALRDMRTVSAAAMAFPWHSGHFRPYAGVGFALSVIGSATAQLDPPNPAPSDRVIQDVNNARSRTTFFGLAGAQWQVRRTAIFAQGSFIPSSSSFLITKPIAAFVGGIRYNFGSSIDQ